MLIGSIPDFAFLFFTERPTAYRWKYYELPQKLKINQRVIFADHTVSSKPSLQKRMMQINSLVWDRSFSVHFFEKASCQLMYPQSNRYILFVLSYQSSMFHVAHCYVLPFNNIFCASWVMLTDAYPGFGKGRAPPFPASSDQNGTFPYFPLVSCYLCAH